MSDDQAAKPKFVAFRNSKFITQGEKLETVIAKVRDFVSNISSPPLKRQYKRYGFLYFFVMHLGGLHVFKENLI